MCTKPMLNVHTPFSHRSNAPLMFRLQLTAKKAQAFAARPCNGQHQVGRLVMMWCVPVKVCLCILLPAISYILVTQVGVRVRDSYTVYLSNTWKAEPESRVEQQSLRRSYYCRNTYRIVAISVETHIDPICVCGCMKTSKNIVYTKFWTRAH